MAVARAQLKALAVQGGASDQPSNVPATSRNDELLARHCRSLPLPVRPQTKWRCEGWLMSQGAR
ncbi:hypothetical protein LI328DRAFT_139140 [Trichoderma asperelloides]|nr:hypothetical protein LI328DRAFT_139140 [Trichoderma asperelloides]